MNTTEVTGAQLASLLSEVDGLDQRIREKTQQLGILLGADLAYGELAPFIRRVISPADGTKMRDTRTLRLQKSEQLSEELRCLTRDRNSKWAEFLQLLAKT